MLIMTFPILITYVALINRMSIITFFFVQ
jgi:hypothetical protein